MSFAPYASTKPSGVDWIGSIPAHWDVRPLVQQFREHFTPNSGGAEDNVLSLSFGRIVDRDVTSNDGLLPESFDTYQIVEPGDIVLRPTDMQNDQRSLRTGIVRRRGIISSAYICLRAGAGAFCEFGHLVLHAVDLTKVLYSLGGGLRQSLKFADLRRLPLPVPPQAEQAGIVAFLNRETGKIDALVAEQERLIALLKEKRQALISHAVTKGLDPNVPIKDSGVEWLGPVPANWEVGGLTRFIGPVIDYRGRTPTKTDDGTFLVTARNVRRGRIDYAVSEEYVDPAEAELLLRRGRPEIGDVLFTMEAPLGEVAIVDRTDIALAQRMVKFRGKPARLCNDFLAYWLMAQPCQEQLQTLATGSTALGIKASKLRMIVCVVPPVAQQQQIVAFLKEQATRIDALVAQSRHAISLLGERRSILISAAVTGKIDVRGLA